MNGAEEVMEVAGFWRRLDRWTWPVVMVPWLISALAMLVLFSGEPNLVKYGGSVIIRYQAILSLGALLISGLATSLVFVYLMSRDLLASWTSAVKLQTSVTGLHAFLHWTAMVLLFNGRL